MRLLQLSFAVASIISVCSATPTPQSKPSPDAPGCPTGRKTCGTYNDSQHILPLCGDGYYDVKEGTLMNSFTMDGCSLCMIYR
jgi:hypothetical protein